MNFGNLQRKLSVKEFEIPLLRIPQNVKTKNYKRLVFEKEKGPVVQGLSCNSYLYSRLRDGNGCAARTMEPEC